MDLATLGGKDPSYRMEVQRVGDEHIQSLGRNGNDIAATQMRRRAFNRFRERVVLVDLY